MLHLSDGFPFPPPPDTLDPPGPTEAFLAFMLGYMLLVMTVIWLLPNRWTDWVFPRRAKDRHV